MKIDFRKIEVRDIEGNLLLDAEGNPDYRDIHKVLGNNIYFGVEDIADQDLARDIYENGEIEVNPRQAILIRRFIDAGFLAFIKIAVFPQLDEIINQNQSKL